ncbi:response regulator [Patescibacteria group bacterium]|nr:response regulator [Patescibacteria group bacterium]
MDGTGNVPKVLVVEDDLEWHRRWEKMLEGRVVILSAFSIKEAEEQFALHPDFSAIVMDVCVPGDDPTTPPLVRKFRETFKGPMIAVSSMRAYRVELLLAGCDHESEKGSLPQKLREVLGLG